MTKSKQNEITHRLIGLACFITFFTVVFILAGLGGLIRLPKPHNISIFITFLSATLVIDLLIYKRGIFRKRSFKITNEGILVVIPYKIVFEIGWDEFESVFIRKMFINKWDEKNTYRIDFVGIESSRSLILHNTSYFSRLKLRKIIDLISENCLKRNKFYTILNAYEQYDWKMISPEKEIGILNDWEYRLEK